MYRRSGFSQVWKRSAQFVSVALKKSVFHLVGRKRRAQSQGLGVGTGWKWSKCSCDICRAGDPQESGKMWDVKAKIGTSEQVVCGPWRDKFEPVYRPWVFSLQTKNVCMAWSPFFFSFFCRNKWWFCISMLRLLSAHGCCACGAWNMMMLICKARAGKKQTTRSQDQRCWPPIAGTTNKVELSTHWRKNGCQNIFTNKLWGLGRNEFPVFCTIFKYPHIRCFNPTKNKSAYGSMWLYSPLQGGAYVICVRGTAKFKTVGKYLCENVTWHVLLWASVNSRWWSPLSTTVSSWQQMVFAWNNNGKYTYYCTVHCSHFFPCLHRDRLHPMSFPNCWSIESIRLKIME